MKRNGKSLKRYEQQQDHLLVFKIDCRAARGTAGRQWRGISMVEFRDDVGFMLVKL